MATIFPSITLEGMPMTIIESFACGTSVIASKYSAMENMINNGYNGYHFKLGDVSDLRKVILNYSKMSTEELKKLSSNARISYENYYSPNVNINKLISIYNECIK
jgi:glycosyltransferase involved in cell wall biosynthesis